MNIQRIEILLSKFFEGNTSLAEEKELKAFFSQHIIPEKFHPLKSMFLYAETENNKHVLDNSFDNNLFSEIGKKEKSKISVYRRFYIYIASGVAATVLVVLGLFNLVDPKINEQDLQKAYQQTQNALIYMSSKLNQGINPTKKVAKLNEEMNNIGKVSVYEKGLNRLSKISELYNKPKEILIDKNN